MNETLNCIHSGDELSRDEQVLANYLKKMYLVYNDYMTRYVADMSEAASEIKIALNSLPPLGSEKSVDDTDAFDTSKERFKATIMMTDKIFSNLDEVEQAHNLCFEVLYTGFPDLFDTEKRLIRKKHDMSKMKKSNSYHYKAEPQTVLERLVYTHGLIGYDLDEVFENVSDALESLYKVYGVLQATSEKIKNNPQN